MAGSTGWRDICPRGPASGIDGIHRDLRHTALLLRRFHLARAGSRTRGGGCRSTGPVLRRTRALARLRHPAVAQAAIAGLAVCALAWLELRHPYDEVLVRQAVAGSEPLLGLSQRNYASALRQSRQYAQAAAAYETALRLNPRRCAGLARVRADAGGAGPRRRGDHGVRARGGGGSGTGGGALQSGFAARRSAARWRERFSTTARPSRPTASDLCGRSSRIRPPPTP